MNQNSYNRRTKHIEVKLDYIRDTITYRVKVRWSWLRFTLIDMLIKPLVTSMFEYYSNLIDYY